MVTSSATIPGPCSSHLHRPLALLNIRSLLNLAEPSRQYVHARGAVGFNGVGKRDHVTFLSIKRPGLRKHAVHSSESHFIRCSSTRGLTSQCGIDHASKLLHDDPVHLTQEGDIQSQEQKIEALISSLPLVRYLRSSVPSSYLEPTRYKEFRLHSNLPATDHAAHLVSGSLFGHTKLPIPPHLFIRAEPACRVIAVGYIGSQLCGHPGYVHGGVLFSLFDDVFARCAALVVPSGVGMTANLNINFRKPSIPDRLYIMRAEVTRQEGRKVWVGGSIRCLPPMSERECSSAEAIDTVEDLSIEERSAEVVAEATALFVEPTFANSVKSMFRSY